VSAAPLPGRRAVTARGLPSVFLSTCALIWRDAQQGDAARNGAAGLAGAVTGDTGQAPPGALPGGQVRGREDLRRWRGDDRAGRDRQPCKGDGMHSFHLESITAGGDCAVLRIDGDIDASAAP
jgi:hypothetical protein